MSYFGTDGIRGKAYSFLSLELAYKVGASLKKLDADEVIIGYDTRESSLDIFNALANGIINSNMKLINAGVISTPAVCLYSRKKKTVAVMITASHNPYYDNGIKIFSNGYKLSKNQKNILEECVASFDENINIKDLNINISADVKEYYIDFLKEIFNEKTNYKIAIDCANGASSFVAKEIFDGLGEDVLVFNNVPNGKNINENCGATYTKAISDIVVENNFDIGFSFDGDADRLAVCDNLGNIYRGDELTYIFARYLKEKNVLKDNTVILTPMSNLGLINNLKENNINADIVNVGDENIIYSMIENDYSYGSEEAGHIIFGDILRTGDAILTALYLLKVLSEKSLSLKELTKDLTMYPTLLKNIKGIDKAKAQDERLIKLVHEINETLKTDGFLMVRPSGTEDLIRVSCCAKNNDLVNKYVNDVINLINEL